MFIKRKKQICKYIYDVDSYNILDDLSYTDIDYIGSHLRIFYGKNGPQLFNGDLCDNEGNLEHHSDCRSYLLVWLLHRVNDGDYLAVRRFITLYNELCNSYKKKTILLSKYGINMFWDIIYSLT